MYRRCTSVFIVDFKHLHTRRHLSVIKVIKVIVASYCFNPFLYPLKTSENLWFSDVFKGYRKRLVAWNGLRLQRKKLIYRTWLLLNFNNSNQINFVLKENYKYYYIISLLRKKIKVSYVFPSWLEWFTKSSFNFSKICNAHVSCR